MKKSTYGYYVVMLSVHGLVRGKDLELGRDADTGGQIKYVVELTEALSHHPGIDKVELITRKVIDKKVDPGYAVDREPLTDRGSIVRLPFGPKRYLKKESLWYYLDEFADQVLKHIRKTGRIPDLIHGHYADAGYVATKLSHLLGIPMLFTGHSLGRVKEERLLEKGLDIDTIRTRYTMPTRIDGEEKALSTANYVITSTHQEVQEQYALYQRYQPDKMEVIPPGTDLSRFFPPPEGVFEPDYQTEIARFLDDPQKPLVLAISRADERKNITSLIQAFAVHPHLKDKANLVIIAGNRDDIKDLDTGTRDTLTNILLTIDRYDLYGSVAYPKHHTAEEVPNIYRLAAHTGGVFVNPALTEPFGLTLIEAAASGLPIVATNDGGPNDIIRNCQNGILIDPLDPVHIGEAIYSIITDKKKWNEFSKNGLTGVRKHYSWESHVEKYMDVIQNLEHKHRKPFWVTSGKKLLEAERLVITDIDDTLIGDQAALDELFESIHSCGKRIGVGIATGRHIDSAVEALKEWNVPFPDILITSVGSEIYYGHDLSEDQDWANHIRYKWEPERLQALMKQYPGIELQPEENQRKYKVSYYIDTKKSPSIKEIIRDNRKNKIFAKTIFSHQQYLDFLPMRASKGLAVWYIANKWGVPMEHILVAGDSGNDEEMLISNTLSVVVGNYSPELEHLKGNPRIFFADGHYARGIIEGINHYNFLNEIKIPEEG